MLLQNVESSENSFATKTCIGSIRFFLGGLEKHFLGWYHVEVFQEIFVSPHLTV